MKRRNIAIQTISGLPFIRIQKISETDIEEVIIKAGGNRAHPDSNELSKACKKNADFVLGCSIIELKILEDEGLDKAERQQKLSKLFREKFPRRPTIVLDRNLLDTAGKRKYDEIMAGPIKSAISTARKQLKQSRTELNATSAVLWVVNNGYTALDHNMLKELVAIRARNDSEEIDAVIVSGAYFYSDSFDNSVAWPIDYIPINLGRIFINFEVLNAAWNELANKTMTALMCEPSIIEEKTKGPVIDLSFEFDEVTYVMPIPSIGSKSDFFTYGRPRSNSTDITACPPIATIFAGLCQHEWLKFKHCRALPNLSIDYNDWVTKEARARSKCQIKPFIVIPITFVGWSEWAQLLPKEANNSVHNYANDLFQKRIIDIISCAQERNGKSVFPHRYMLLITEEIGQDLAFDVSHLAEVRTLLDGTDHYDEVWTDKPMFFEQALAVAAAEAIARGMEFVFWEKDTTYAWG
jgi:hypothetical protein